MHMIRTLKLTLTLPTSVLWIAACATAGDDGQLDNDRQTALGVLQERSGATVGLELNEFRITRTVNMTPRFPVPGHATAPADAAANFLTSHAAVFQLTATDATNFVATRIDVEPERNISHITLQRMYAGFPVFQGAITVHMDGNNGVLRALGDEFYVVDAPTNNMRISATDAANAA